MSKRIRHRHQRMRLYYRVIRPSGTVTVISAAQFNANVAAGNLIPDKNDRRLARVLRRLTFTTDRATGQLIFRSTQKAAVTDAAPNSTEPLLRNWLESERTLTSAEARARMLVSVPRVHTEAVRLY